MGLQHPNEVTRWAAAVAGVPHPVLRPGSLALDVVHLGFSWFERPPTMGQDVEPARSPPSQIE
jgi:hypothetical protein